MAEGVPISMMLEVPGSPEEAHQRIVMATSGAKGYTVAPAGPNTLILTRRYLPTWALVVGIIAILSLVGIALLLFVRKTETLTITLTKSKKGTSVSVTGPASQEMIQRLNSLQPGAVVQAAVPVQAAPPVAAPVAPVQAAPSVPAAGPAQLAPAPAASPAQVAPAPAPAPPVQAAPPMAAPAPVMAGSWHSDPLGRYALRFYDGAAWTDNVSSGNGSQEKDPLGTSPSAPALSPTP